MGYTRYWQRTDKPINKEFLDDINKIIEKCQKKGIKLCDGNGEGTPTVTMEVVAFNGNAEHDLDHETCYFDNEEKGFSFCKTARKPYDYAVREALKSAKKHGLITDVRSDGTNNEIISDADYLNQ